MCQRACRRPTCQFGRPCMPMSTHTSFCLHEPAPGGIPAEVIGLWWRQLKDSALFCTAESFKCRLQRLKQGNPWSHVRFPIGRTYLMSFTYSRGSTPVSQPRKQVEANSARGGSHWRWHFRSGVQEDDRSQKARNAARTARNPHHGLGSKRKKR